MILKFYDDEQDKVILDPNLAPYSLDSIQVLKMLAQGHTIEQKRSDAEQVIWQAAKQAKMDKFAAKITDRSSRIAQLKAVDWSLVNSFADAKPILRHLVREFLKDDE